MDCALTNDFFEMYRLVSPHEKRQNPELQAATFRMKAALAALQRIQEEEDGDDMDGQIEKGIA